MVELIGDNLDRSGGGVHPPPSAERPGTEGTRTVAQALGISQHIFERYLKGQLKRPRQDLRSRMDREAEKRWQPQVRAKAKLQQIGSQSRSRVPVRPHGRLDSGWVIWPRGRSIIPVRERVCHRSPE